MSNSTAQQLTPAVPGRTLAQRFLRSLNNLGVIVADSTKATRTD